MTCGEVMHDVVFGDAALSGQCRIGSAKSSMTFGEVTMTCGEVSDDMRRRDPRCHVEDTALKSQSREGYKRRAMTYSDVRGAERSEPGEVPRRDDQHAAWLRPPGSRRSGTCGAAARMDDGIA